MCVPGENGKLANLRTLTKRLDDKKAEGQEESGGVEAMLREGRAKYEAEVCDLYDRLNRELEKKKQNAIRGVREGGEGSGHGRRRNVTFFHRYNVYSRVWRG
jgi:hypothetical protein